MKIGIYYGSETGNSEMVCYDIEAELKNDFDVEVKDLDDIAPADLSTDAFYIMVVSTHGDGDMPIPADHFVERLKKQDADLKGINFAIFGMGDTLYDATYNWGSSKVAKAMTDRGAKQVGERGLHDASGYDEPEDIAVPWAREIMTQVAGEVA
ncbi:MAG: flavodoxin family protein [Pseudomonadota bacterium]